MEGRRFALIAGIGCIVLIVLLVAIASLLFLAPRWFGTPRQAAVAPTVERATPPPQAQATQRAVPTLTVSAPATQAAPSASPVQVPGDGAFVALYDQVNPGVVSIQVSVQRNQITGQAAGSGFIIDDQGHIVTNNHVVESATQVIVSFYNGFEATAEIVGTDVDSDLAVIKVDSLPDGAHPLALGDSDSVRPGEMAVAIGNPFALEGSMSAGIVSAVGRLLPSAETSFSIPQAIQTDAAINPGNSGGPLIDMNGQVIGVNAQIATGGVVDANAGVGFAIPVNVVRLVVPVLIESGSYQWPWLGIQGTSVNLFIQQANNLQTQDGAYVDQVLPNSPAEAAGLQGSTGNDQVQGLQVPVGGDVIVAVNGKSVQDFSALLSEVSFRRPEDQVTLTILRGGQQQDVTVTLAPRPQGIQPLQ